MRSISIGGPQILGSNYRMIGHPSPQAMYDAFQADERYHLAENEGPGARRDHRPDLLVPAARGPGGTALSRR
jgi:hypothetical protein